MRSTKIVGLRYGNGDDVLNTTGESTGSNPAFVSSAHRTAFHVKPNHQTFLKCLPQYCNQIPCTHSLFSEAARTFLFHGELSKKNVQMRSILVLRFTEFDSTGERQTGAGHSKEQFQSPQNCELHNPLHDLSNLTSKKIIFQPIFCHSSVYVL